MFFFMFLVSKISRILFSYVLLVVALSGSWRSV